MSVTKQSRLRTCKNSNDRITVEALVYYVPLFHMGDRALEQLLEPDLDPGLRNALEAQSRLRDLVVNRIASLAGPLITRELNKLIKNSHLNSKDDNLFTVLYYAGINGMIKGLRHFDVDKLNKSSTNYLFQWIVTYAKKELSVIEAPFGVAPSRFQRYKKISAVRKKMSEEMGRYATNEEVLAYFHSGKADLKTMNGRLEKSNKPYAVNRNMTLELVEEQENFEQNLNHVNLLDPLEDYHADVTLSQNFQTPFVETPFGVFVELWNFTDTAKAVLLSDLNYANIPPYLAGIAASLPPAEYKNVSNRWKDLLKDVHGPFYSFLISEDGTNFEQFNREQTLKNIRAQKKHIKPERYLPLFVGGKMEKM